LPCSKKLLGRYEKFVNRDGKSGFELVINQRETSVRPQFRGAEGMKPMTTTEPTKTTTETAVAAKVQKSATITLNANGWTMAIVAERKPDDSARTYVITTDPEKKSERGMTEQHATFEAAKDAIAVLATKAAKQGWVRRAARPGFLPKPDAFTSLPAAPKAKK
jgi:hypothetical protein